MLRTDGSVPFFFLAKAVLIPFGAPAHRWLNISFVNAITDFIPLYSFAHNWIRQHKNFDFVRDSFRDSVYKVFFYRRSQASFTHVKF